MPPKKKSISQKPSPQHQQIKSTRNLRSNPKDIQEAQSKPKPRSAPKNNPKDSQPKKKIRKSLPQQQPQPTAADPKKKKEQKPSKKKKQQQIKKPKQQQKKQKPKQTQKENKQEQQDKTQLKKVILKGTVPVDQYFSKVATFKVYVAEEKVYAATLNQSNINANNNKFYILQILINESNPKDIVFFTRWGRVGVQGQKSQENMKSIEFAIKQYNKKLHQKTKTYTVVEMNYQENAKEAQEKPQRPKNEPESKLDPSVQELIRLIFDMKMMAKQMKQIGYDAKKMPLGKLAKASISKGYQILKSLMEQIKSNHSTHRNDSIRQLSGNFYSQIPHDFGFKNMLNFVLDNEQKVKQKLQMLQSLQDIQVFTKLIDEGSNSDLNQLDSNYAKLNIKINPLPKDSHAYQLLLKYVTNTHASTHTAYKLAVTDIFQLEKETQLGRYTKDIPNKQLLWHGSRLTNFVGILSQGLRIAPPQAPVTGYMFGKGVYFADMVTKSANYCFTSRENNTGLMLLCEVALGEMTQKFYADYYANLLPEGKKSTKGCGKTAPKEGEMLGDVLVPCGEGAATGIMSTSLLYNEFIVYDVAQIKFRYLMKMKFNYS